MKLSNQEYVFLIDRKRERIEDEKQYEKEECVMCF